MLSDRTSWSMACNTACIAAMTFAGSSVANAQGQPATNIPNAHCTTGLPSTNPGDTLAAPTLSQTNENEAGFDTTWDDQLKDAVILSADSANSDPNDPEQVVLNGTISIRHQQGAISAENARFDTRTNVATIDGEMKYESAGLQVSSSDAKLDVKNDTFELGESGYELDNDGIVSRGRAQRINRNQQGNLRLKDATYTSCPEGDNGWLISADNIRLNPDKGIGTAQDITLRFKDVPIFYAPWFSFPINNQRKTGFLTPRFDQNDKTGLEYRQPFYWNIRPDTDATFTMRTMSDRGVQLQSELRHLNRIGAWTLNHEFMGNDNRFSPGVNRHYTRLRHAGGLSNGWTTSIDLNNVSDKDYFEDLGDTLNIAGITHLERRGDLTYTAENFDFRARLLSYQTIDETIEPDQRPYQQLPQFTFNYRKSLPDKELDATLNTELVYFDRDNSVNGARLDIKPRLEWNKHRKAWYSTVAGSIRHTHYDLSELPSLSRTVPIFSTEVGMYFDRLHEADGSLLTLEPRLYYLYAKRTEQDQLPVFDTGALDFNFSQLFRENRFSGADRVNDANQLTLALSSRRINSQGREKFQASLGQILYFDDRTVTLPDDTPETSSTSDLVGELKLEFDQNWSGSTAIQWNPTTATTERSSASISYRDGTDRLVNIGHRYLRDDGEFVSASFAWPIKNNWRIASGWNYSLDDNRSIETVLGLEYEDCCWAFRTAARRYITDDGRDHNTAYFFQLVLKGLAPVGQNVTEVLSESVGGYTSASE